MYMCSIATHPYLSFSVNNLPALYTCKVGLLKYTYLFITDEGMTLPYLLARGSCMHVLIKSLHQKHVLVKITSTMLFQLLTPVEQLKYSQS